MPFQKISGNFVELSVDNYLGSIKSGSSISDLGFRTYRESVAGVMPVSGTGGSPGISLALNTTNPLSSDADLRLVKDSTNRQGEGFSVDFSIQNRHQSKVLQISFDMELISGTYTNQDLIPKTGTFTVASTTCTVTASHSLVVGQAVNMSFPGGTAPASGLYVITAIVPGVSFSFTVASGSGSGVSCAWNILSSLRVYIIANPTTNPTVIEPVNTGLQLGIANQKVKHIASFQTNNSGNSYRMVIHITKPGILPYTVDFANFKVWESTQSIGAIITDWVSYVPTIQGNSGGTLTGFYWRRVGSNLEINGRGTLGTTSGSLFQFSLPNGLSIGSINSVSNTQVGIMDTNDTNSSSYKQWILLGTSGNTFLQMSHGGDAYGRTDPSLTPQNTNNISSSSSFTFQVSVPIQGWGSSVQLSSDSGDGRVVACRIENIVSGTTTSNGFAWSTTSYDTHNMIRTSGSGSTQRTEIVIPISGYYRVSASVNFNNTGSVEMYKNGTTSIANMVYTTLSSNIANVSTSVYLLAGDYIFIRTSAAYTSVTASGAALTVERISAGTQQIAAIETVACRYEKTDGANVLSSATDIIYNIRTRDTHSAYNTTNGEYTVPISGYYQINCIVGLSSGSLYNIHVLKNGSTTDFTTVGGVTTINRRNLSTGNYYLAGDKIKIQAIADTTRSTDTSTGANTLFICRLGI